METREKELVEKLALENPELKALLDAHKEFEAKLDEMNQRPYLSPEEDMERKRLQKAKLAGKDKIERILASHRAGA